MLKNRQLGKRGRRGIVSMISMIPTTSVITSGTGSPSPLPRGDLGALNKLSLLLGSDRFYLYSVRLRSYLDRCMV